MSAPVRKYWSVADLMAADLPEPPWVVPDLLPVGLSLLAGRPKLGKSFLALQLAVAVGTGGVFLDQRVESGRALYVALEDSPRRMRKRLRDMGAADATDSGNLLLTFAWPDMGSEGLSELGRVLAQHSPRLVVVDTLARSFTGRVDWDRLGQATEALAGVQELALAHDCAVLLVDHHKKSNGADGEDVVDDVMGSTGKAAVADVVLGLYRKRGERDATLRLTGRDVEDGTLRLSFDRVTCSWALTEGSDGVRAGSVQASVVAALEGMGGSATVTELAGFLAKPKSNVARELGELVAKGVVRKESADHYSPHVLI